MLSIEVNAANDREAVANAVKMRELLKSPLVRMAVEGDGIKLAGDGNPVVHHPQRL